MTYYKSGCLYWREGFQIGDARKAHTKLGTLLNTGYLSAYLKGTAYQVHRLIWCYFYGQINSQLDHVNGVRTDNRIKNLRPASQQQNSWNSKNKNPKTGFRGVYKLSGEKGKKKFWAMILLKNKKRKSLGVFLTAKEASLVYEKHLKSKRGEWVRN